MRILGKIGALVAAVAATAAVAVPGSATSVTPAVERAQAPVGLSSWCPAHTSAVVLGDSSSTGYGTTGYVGGDGSPWMDTYSGWVAQLRREWTGTTWSVLSRNGALVSDYLPGGRWPSTVGFPDTVAQMQPALVVIMLGGNEYGTDRSPATYRSNLTLVTNRIRAAAPRASLLYVSMWEFAFRWSSQPAVNPYSAYTTQMREAAAQHGGVYVDLTKELHSAGVHPETGLFIRDEYGPGNSVHATDAGNWVVRGVMRKVLGC